MSSITLGVDFGSLASRMAYLHDGEPIIVPSPPHQVGTRGTVFIERHEGAPLGLRFSSLKYRLLDNRAFTFRGSLVYPRDVALRLFTNLKQTAETYSGEDIDGLVVSVPGHLSAATRSIVRQLAQEAGFPRVRLISDGTAAAVAFTRHDPTITSTMLVVSIGYIGFEVELVRSARGRLRELGHEAEPGPSGQDIDVEIIHAAARILADDGVPLPFGAFTGQWFELGMLASRTKEELSLEGKAFLDLPPYVTGSTPQRLVFDRSLVERCGHQIMDAVLGTIDRVLEASGLETEAIDDVILVGGTARLECVRARLRPLFGDRIHGPDDDVLAVGAALRGRDWDPHKPTAPRTSDRPEVTEPASTDTTDTTDTTDDARPDDTPLTQADGLAGPQASGATVRAVDVSHGAIIDDFVRAARRVRDEEGAEAMSRLLAELERHIGRLRDELERSH